MADEARRLVSVEEEAQPKRPDFVDDPPVYSFRIMRAVAFRLQVVSSTPGTRHHHIPER